MAIHVKNLKIDTYRGIKNLQLNNFKDINIFTGDNNTGKTSILEVLNSLKNPLATSSWKIALRIPENSFSSNQLSLFESFKLLFNIENQKVIKYSYSLKKEKTISIYAHENEVLLTSQQRDKILGVIDLEEEQNKYIPNKNLELEFLENDNLVNRDVIFEISRKLTTTDSKEEIKTVYVSPFQHIESTVYLNDILDNPILFQDMLEVLKEFDKDIISINAGKIGNTVVYKVLSKQKAIPLNVYGDGMKKAILLISAVVSAKNGILLLDEFETAIHTSAMNKVFTWILKTCLKLNVQLFLTSHNKEAIEKVLSCSEELQSHINLYTLYKKEDKIVARELSAKKALEASEEFGLELR
ncbi:AAA family ATPase [Fusobacterium mortiferum]|uniref:AAA family ATPase n=1 Tax=Fusobacterium mortiferum TaxID=850 RepID=UPI00158E2A74|nr:AAA family ATPase [Fusobacterium mortiferum]